MSARAPFPWSSTALVLAPAAAIFYLEHRALDARDRAAGAAGLHLGQPYNSGEPTP